MSQRTSRNGIVLLLLLIAAGVFGAGIDWGLPSRAGDQFLLGKDHSGWRLESLTAKVPDIDASRGADVVPAAGDANAIVPLNDTDARRAQILCRYRLYSEQPDEMITFRSLSQMKPTLSGLDPRLYQYGGLWIYSIAAIIQGGGALGKLPVGVTGGRSFYIGNPSEFGKFYIAARGFSAAWGLIGVLVVFALIRRLSVSRRAPGKLPLFLPAAGTLCFICMPVVITMAHEAKPHLPAVVLILMAILAASKYIETGTTRWAVLTGLVCGAAAGMVLWGIVALAVLPLMVLLRREPFRARRLSLYDALALAIAVYCVSNPFVIYHLFVDSGVLSSNLGNTSAMYHFGNFGQGTIVAIQLIAAGASPLILIAGVTGAVLLAVTGCRCRSKSHVDSEITGITGSNVVESNASEPLPEQIESPAPPPAASTYGVGILLATLSILALIQFVATAAGKPGEYGRFALLPDIALAIAATAALARLRIGALPQAALATLLIAATALYGAFYVVGFLHDSLPGHQTTRQLEAQQLQSMLDSRKADYAKRFPGARPSKTPPYRPILGVYADPAPYDLPPVDLNGWNIIRLPKGYDPHHGPAVADVIVKPDESISWLNPTRTPISWADKRFDIWP